MPQISIDANWLDGLLEQLKELQEKREDLYGRDTQSVNDEAVGHAIRLVAPEKYMEILSGAKPEKLKPKPRPARPDYFEIRLKYCRRCGQSVPEADYNVNHGSNCATF